MNVPVFATALIFGLMLAEMRLSNRNERALRNLGAVRPDGDPYVALAALYPLAFLLMGIEGVWRAAGDSGPDPEGPAWLVSGVLLLAASKALKYWAIASLGVRWSFRVWILPGRALVRTGPYAYVAHPNYVAVIGELLGAAMMVGAPVTGPLMTASFGLALAARIRFENRILAAAGTGFDPSEGKG